MSKMFVRGALFNFIGSIFNCAGLILLSFVSNQWIPLSLIIIGGLFVLTALIMMVFDNYLEKKCSRNSKRCTTS